MNLIELGSGPNLVFVPGLQGRWEYMRPAVEALSQWFRVVTFSLSDEPSSNASFDADRGLDSYVTQIQTALDQADMKRAVICGVSFGGLIALRFAAECHDRTAELVLASTPGPMWHLRKRHEIYARLPYVFGPLFAAETPWRLRLEMTTSLPSKTARLRFAVSQLQTLVGAPLSFARMARRARMIDATRATADCAHVTAPTLIVTGEPGLDHIVSASGSHGYVSLIPGARAVVLERTGHLGAITRPQEFATIIRDFADATRTPSTRTEVA